MTAGRPRGRVLVVGGGRAGLAAAEELRRLGHAGEIVILHDEAVGPYDRPACAKGLLTGHKRPRDVQLPLLDGLDAEWRLGRRVVDLDAAEHAVLTDTGEVIGYDRLVVASGAAPVAPAGWPIGEPGLHVLYRLADAWALRTSLRTAGRVAVVGAGLTGCEVASAVRSLARECVLIDSGQQALARPLGEVAAGLVTREIARDGVELRLGHRVERLFRRRRRWVLVLDDGEEVIADVVVAATGDRPDTGWLRSTRQLDLTDGVLCDERLRVVGIPDAVAAGTVARWPNLRYSTVPGRVGQWIAALEQGRAAARTLMAGDAPGPAVTHVPRFWSDQFGLCIQVCGSVPPDAEVSVTHLRPGRQDTARAGVVVGHHVDGRLAGVVAVNAQSAFTALTRGLLATAGHTVAPGHDRTAPRSGARTHHRPGAPDLRLAVG